MMLHLGAGGGPVSPTLSFCRWGNKLREGNGLPLRLPRPSVTQGDPVLDRGESRGRILWEPTAFQAIYGYCVICCNPQKNSTHQVLIWPFYTRGLTLRHGFTEVGSGRRQACLILKPDPFMTCCPRGTGGGSMWQGHKCRTCGDRRRLRVPGREGLQPREAVVLKPCQPELACVSLPRAVRVGPAHGPSPSFLVNWL